MKIAFFGTSNFGVPTLRALWQHFGVEVVFTGVAKPAHRGQKLQNTPIDIEAQRLGISNIYTPEKLLPQHANLLGNIDLAIVVAYGLILPSFILNAVKQKCINVHPSALPLFRGAAPIERSLESGAVKTQICAIEMTKELDAGNILIKQDYEIASNENSIMLHEKFAEIGAKLIVELITAGVESVVPVVQNQCLATYAKKISKAELEILGVSNTNAINILNKIRAFASYGYCYTMHNNTRVKIIEAQFSNNKRTKYDILCLDGYASPTIIRPQGKGDIKV